MRKQVLLVGLGLIGGSLALTIKKEHPDCEIVGYDVEKEAGKLALSLQIIDRVTEDYLYEATLSDLIILATPVESAIAIMDKLSSVNFKKNCIVTDVGSTKASIVQKGEEIARNGVCFIGGHPMAGSHKTGVTASNERLFENAFYILTPTNNTPASKVIQLQNWLRGTRARFMELNPDEHDKLTGMISHLPHVIASALVQQTGEMGKDHPIVSQLAAGGFRDLTRIASASPAMWRDILLQNKQVLLDLLNGWEQTMKYVRQIIEGEDRKAIYAFFENAKKLRDELPVGEKGALMPFNDLYVDIPDHPGVISDVTGILAEEKISITNIRIIEAREDIMGVLRLSFRSKEDLITARRALENHMYDTYVTP